jgi:hypothetical protein
MPPARVVPQAAVVAAPAIAEGTVGYDMNNKRFIYRGGVWLPDSASIAAQQDAIEKKGGSK